MSSIALARPRKQAPSSTRHEELRSVLLARRGELAESVREQLWSVRADRATADHVGVPDDGDVSAVDIQEDISLALVHMKCETLQRIDAALARLNAGSYGHCIGCGADIAAVRLRALPFAARCLECENAREADANRRRHAVRDHDVQTGAAERFR